MIKMIRFFPTNTWEKKLVEKGKRLGKQITGTMSLLTSVIGWMTESRELWSQEGALLVLSQLCEAEGNIDDWMKNYELPETGEIPPEIIVDIGGKLA